MSRVSMLAVLVLALLTAAPASAQDPVGTPDPVATPDPVLTLTPEPTPAPPGPGPVSGGSLAVGFTEANPNLVWPAKPLAEPFAHWRDEVAAIRPSYYRLQLDWASLEPDPGGPLLADRPSAGCVRDVPPCVAYGGLREQLQALAARQAEGGWETVVAISGTPAW